MSERKDLSTAAYSMLYLCGCVLSGEKPDATRLSALNIKALYDFSRFHSLTSLVCEGLERAGYVPGEEERECMAAFQQAKAKAIRKNIMLDAERARIVAFMEQNGIWYMPLKGVILKDMYPMLGLRQMADHDILFDENYRQAIRDWFVEQGYEVKAYGVGNHDVYLKEPVYNYEMHTSLYGEAHRQELQDYYVDVRSRLIKDAGNEFGYHFTDEDYYLYFISHGFKHFDGGGTGFRFLCDLYVYLKAKGPTMDLAYIERELQVLELADFERDCRELVSAIFDDIHAFEFERLTQGRRETLTYFLMSGTYGTTENRIGKKGKLRYLLGTAFPGTTVLRSYHPIFRHKWLMPIGWSYRAVTVLFTRPGRVKQICRAVMRSKKHDL